MNTAVPIYCHGCGAPVTSTVFYENGGPYHFGCRPSQKTVIVGSDVQREHADLLERIAGLEAVLKMEAENRASLSARIAALEAELAALKARRCETCRWQEQGAMDPDSCGVLQGFIPCRDFGCNQWRPREAAE